MAPSLATAWQESPDGLTYDFQLRQGVTFHNGDPLTADDVAFSFARYKGAGAGELKKQVKAIEVITPHQVRFHLLAPWPDFLTFYATPTTGAAWIVPTHYKQHLQSMRRNVLPVKRIDGSLVMVQQHAAHALLELLEVGKTPSGPNPGLHHAPETFDGMQMVSTSRWQKMQTKLLVPVRKRRRERVRPVDATAVDDHDHRLPRVAKERPQWMDILAKPFGIKLGDDCIEDLRGPILDGTKHGRGSIGSPPELTLLPLVF